MVDEKEIARLRAKLADLNAGKFQWPTLASLDGPPKVGKYYRVPTIRAKFHGLEDDWPVRGPLHQDLPYGIRDWHLDRRFLLPRQEKHCAGLEPAMEAMCGVDPDPGPERRWPGSRVAAFYAFVWVEPDVILPGLQGSRPGIIRGTPPTSRLKDLRCNRPTVEPEPLPSPWPEITETYGDPAMALRSNDGRPLCPHQKLDLTGEPVDCDGVAVCPLHRLRVKVRDV